MFGAGAPQPAEPRRTALNGHAYTWEQLIDYYGNDAWQRGNEAEDRDAPQLAVHTEEGFCQLPAVETYAVPLRMRSPEHLCATQPLDVGGTLVAIAESKRLGPTDCGIAQETSPLDRIIFQEASSSHHSSSAE